MAVRGLPRQTRTSTSASWTRWTSSARRASRSSPRTPRSATARRLKLNIVDTPGHADFGGEVERGADDGRRRAAARRRLRGAAAADALRPAQGAGGPAAGDPRRQQGRPARTPASPRSCTRSRSCSSTSTPTRTSSTSRSSTRTPRPADGVAGPTRGRGDATCARCSTCWSSTCPRPSTTPTTRCRRSSPTSTPLRTSAAWRSAACATARSARARTSPGAAPTARPSSAPRSSELYVTEALDRVAGRRGRAGRDRRASPACPDVTIGETLADLEDPRPLPVIHVDEPSLSVVRSASTPRRWPAATGDKLTARQVKARLDAELVGNVSLRVLPTRSARTPGRSRAAASCSSRCSWRSCAARASS